MIKVQGIVRVIMGTNVLLGAALLFAGGVGWLGRGRHARYDNLTALVLTGALALGVLLASDVFHSGTNVDNLLFGSLLASRSEGRFGVWTLCQFLP